MIEFHESALTEARDAQAWYAERSRRVATKFGKQLDRAVQRMVSAPSNLPSSANPIATPAFLASHI